MLLQLMSCTLLFKVGELPLRLRFRGFWLCALLEELGCVLSAEVAKETQSSTVNLEVQFLQLSPSAGTASPTAGSSPLRFLDLVTGPLYTEEIIVNDQPCTVKAIPHIPRH